jgi:hypothetical protein
VIEVIEEAPPGLDLLRDQLWEKIEEDIEWVVEKIRAYLGGLFVQRNKISVEEMINFSTDDVLDTFSQFGVGVSYIGLLEYEKRFAAKLTPDVSRFVGKSLVVWIDNIKSIGAVVDLTRWLSHLSYHQCCRI